MSFQVNQTIPLAFNKILNGSPLTGLAITVTVYDAGSNSILLASTALTEVSPGVYIYNWAGVTVFTNCRAVYTENSNQWDDFFTIVDIDNVVENRTGHAF